METTAIPSTAGGGHGAHHGPAPFPGQPPAHVLPPPAGGGVTQPPDIPDTAKGSPLPHWDGVLVGSVATVVSGDITHLPTPDYTVQRNIYVNGAFNYGDFASAEQAVAAVKELTRPQDKPAAVIWKDKFGIVHAQALLAYGGAATKISLGPAGPGIPDIGSDTGPTALHLAPGDHVLLGHPEALMIVDGDLVVKTSVPQTIPVPVNGGTGWVPGGAS